MLTGSTRTRAAPCWTTRSSGWGVSSSSNLYWKPLQPPARTATRRADGRCWAATISATRSAARSDTLKLIMGMDVALWNAGLKGRVVDGVVLRQIRAVAETGARMFGRGWG